MGMTQSNSSIPGSNLDIRKYNSPAPTLKPWWISLALLSSYLMAPYKQSYSSNQPPPLVISIETHMPPYPILPVPTPWGIPQGVEKLLLQTLLWHHSGSLHPTRIWPWLLLRAQEQARDVDKSKKLGQYFPPTPQIQVCSMSHNLVYCLTCKICGLQYVGQTKRTFHERLYKHFHDIRNKDLTKPKDDISPSPTALLTQRGSRAISWCSSLNPVTPGQPKKCATVWIVPLYFLPYSTPLKVAQIDMYTKTDTKPVEIFLENDQRLEFISILGPKNWASEAHILHAFKVLAMSMWNNTDVKQVKSFWESGQTPEFLLSLGPKMAQ